MLQTPQEIALKKDDKKAVDTPNPDIWARLFHGRRCDGCHEKTDSWYWDMNTGMLYCPKCRS
jgi:late competence protein required for DNA uptake (superfamily II DNA/RNA helicase)